MARRGINNPSTLPGQFDRTVDGVCAVLESYAYEFIGLGMIALCLAVIAMPSSSEAPAERVRER